MPLAALLISSREIILCLNLYIKFLGFSPFASNLNLGLELFFTKLFFGSPKIGKIAFEFFILSIKILFVSATSISIN